MAEKLTAKQRAIVDEFGELEGKVAEFKAVTDRCNKLKREILSWFDDSAAGEAFVAVGSTYTVEVSARRTERTILDLARLAKKLGKVFWERCSFPVKVLDKLLEEEEIPIYISEAQSGLRTVVRVSRKVVRKRKAG